LRDEDAAKECFHDAFLKIKEKITSYNSEYAGIYTWMARICRNQAIDITRSKHYKQGLKTDTVEDNVYTVERTHQTIQSTDSIGISEKLALLKEEHRFVIEKLYYQGYTQSEISDEFALPLGTVKTRTRAALSELRKHLQ
jgi:RNA polymerase sigma factor (sigma-70 family)